MTLVHLKKLLLDLQSTLTEPEMEALYRALGGRPCGVGIALVQLLDCLVDVDEADLVRSRNPHPEPELCERGRGVSVRASRSRSFLMAWSMSMKLRWHGRCR